MIWRPVEHASLASETDISRNKKIVKFCVAKEMVVCPVEQALLASKKCSSRKKQSVDFCDVQELDGHLTEHAPPRAVKDASDELHNE